MKTFFILLSLVFSAYSSKAEIEIKQLAAKQMSIQENVKKSNLCLGQIVGFQKLFRNTTGRNISKLPHYLKWKQKRTSQQTKLHHSIQTFRASTTLSGMSLASKSLYDDTKRLLNINCNYLNSIMSASVKELLNEVKFQKKRTEK